MKISDKLNGRFMVSIGLLIIGLLLILQQYSVNLPDFVYGLCYGSALALEILGIYSMTHNVTKYRKFKRNLLEKLI